MQTLKAIDPATASEESNQLLGAAELLVGRVVNMLRVIANSPAILETYLRFNRAFEQTRMSNKLRGLFTVTLAQLLSSEYVLSVAAAFSGQEVVNREEFNSA